MRSDATERQSCSSTVAINSCSIHERRLAPRCRRLRIGRLRNGFSTHSSGRFRACSWASSPANLSSMCGCRLSRETSFATPWVWRWTPLGSRACCKASVSSAQWITGITDNKGIILARSERHAEFVGKPLPKDLLESSRAAKGVFRATSVAGQDILRATERSKIAGWLVSATVAVSYVEASRRRGQWFAMAMIGTALALGLGLAYIFGGFMARSTRGRHCRSSGIGTGQTRRTPEVACSSKPIR